MLFSSGYFILFIYIYYRMYKQKYLKYKQKYSNLLNHINSLENNSFNGGGNDGDELYIHKYLLGGKSNIEKQIYHLLQNLPNKNPDYSLNSNITILNNNSIYDFINSIFYKYKIVLFYSPKCPHCNKLSSTFNEFSNNLSNNNEYNIGVYNIDDNVITEQNFSQYVSGVPTILKFEGNVIELFNDEPTIENLMEFANIVDNNTLNQNIIEFNYNNLDEYIHNKNKKKLCILFHRHSCPYCRDFYDEFNNFYEKFDDDSYIVAHFNSDNNELNKIDEKLLKHIQGVPTILKIKNNNVYPFKNKRNINNLLQFFK